MRYRYILIRTTKRKRENHNTKCCENSEKLKLSYIAGMTKSTSTLENSGKFLKS